MSPKKKQVVASLLNRLTDLESELSRLAPIAASRNPFLRGQMLNAKDRQIEIRCEHNKIHNEIMSLL